MLWSLRNITDFDVSATLCGERILQASSINSDETIQRMGFN